MKSLFFAASYFFVSAVLINACGLAPSQPESKVLASYEFCNAAEDASAPLESYADGITYELVDIKFDFGELPFQPVCIGPVDFKLGDRIKVAVEDGEKTNIQYEKRALSINQACIGTNWDKSRRQVEFTGTVALSQMNQSSEKNFSGDVFIYGEVSHPATDTLVVREHWDYRAGAKCRYGFLGTGGDCFKVLDHYNILIDWPVGKKVDFDALDLFGETERHHWIKSIKDGSMCYSKYQLLYRKI